MKKQIIELLVATGSLTQKQGENIINAKDQTIIHGHLYTYTEAQLAIYLAMGLLEKVGADILLTNSGLDLQHALDKLTAYLIKEQEKI